MRQLFMGISQLQYRPICLGGADDLQAHGQAPGLNPTGTLMLGRPARVGPITTSIQR